MKARRVKGLDPDGTLAENARRIVAVRLGELFSFVPRVLDPAEVTTLHDMRIAAKRLRYVLELCEPALGPMTADGVDEARKLQEILGEIHDCDELLPRLHEHAAILVAADVATIRAAASGKDLDPALVRDAPSRDAHRGLATLIVYVTTRRALLFDRFVERVDRLDRDCFRERMEKALARAAEPAREPALSGAVHYDGVRAAAFVDSHVATALTAQNGDPA